MTPTEYYRRLIESDQILPDDQQALVINQLQIIYDSLTLNPKKTLLRNLISGKRSCTPGLYLWGEVGIGKTFLMDCFYYCLPFKGKLRIHFLKFMKIIHEQLKSLQGKSNPLEKIAKEFAKEISVICFDELLVNDIADAMLLSGLFKALYQQQICLMFTSNCPLDELYLKGLQRESFLPAVNLIKKNSTVIHITSHQDYRLRNYMGNTFYYYPLGKQAQEMLRQQFKILSKRKPRSQEPIILFNRTIKVEYQAGSVIWFNFLDICGIPRSKDDYIAIASKYHTILVSDIFSIQPEQNDLARSFINLVDVLYDANRRLIISAEKPIEQLYLCGRMLFEFARTRSRLMEMQTLAWQQKCESLLQEANGHILLEPVQSLLS